MEIPNPMPSPTSSPKPQTTSRRLRGSTLPLVQLGRLEYLGQGGQARIHRPENYRGLLYKEYKDPREVRGDSLHLLRKLRLSLPPADRAFLDESTAWPAIVVVNSDRRVAGFLMAPAAGRFFHQFGRAGRKPVDLQYLLYESKPAWGGLEIPDIDGRLEVARGAARLVELLHKNNAVVGDISMSNLLWTTRPTVAVYLIDCDGVRRQGYPPVLEQRATPHWKDPADPGRATLNTDRYKLAQLVVRVLGRTAYWEPPDGLPQIKGLPGGTARSIARLLSRIDPDRMDRPEAVEWLQALQ